jgi:hypothetical protein
MAGGPTPLSEGDAVVEGNIAVSAHGYLRRVFHVGGRYFCEIEAWADGSGTFIAPLRATVLKKTGYSPEPPPQRKPATGCAV